MRVTGTMAAVALATAALGLPPAQADHVLAGCRGSTATHGTITGEGVYEAFVVGFVVGSVGETVSIVCEIRMGTNVRASTTPGAPGSVGVTVAVVAERLQYTRSSLGPVHLCAVYSTDHGGGSVCVVL